MPTPDELRAAADAWMTSEGKLLEVPARTGALYVLPAWGFLEAVEVRFSPPIPNMDAASPYQIILAPIDPMPGFQVFARVRNVRDTRLPR